MNASTKRKSPGRDGSEERDAASAIERELNEMRPEEIEGSDDLSSSEQPAKRARMESAIALLSS